ncbi:hypothetical protein NBRC10512_001079 [Rhodotorula toruloides]|uniref:RHTO0S06e10946g1_1 n=2 Tax=Rhodotorula toruloides TaxID=5286 RepID=A0A061AY92_RHOTO|nr:uncharacterized protein RHTO_04400 [Rhodotorula toruloides NP11]EMS19399.1 hypothetical protein RHTO_04400 [Rhodotorula toruloides NP11]CDR42205.1 RHTO0S06e10946g1_1 [Rhodotorula toruloides]
MATAATATASPVHSRQVGGSAHRKEGKSVFRSISRFLGGGKGRPKGVQGGQVGAGGAMTSPGNRETSTAGLGAADGEEDGSERDGSRRSSVDEHDVTPQEDVAHRRRRDNSLSNMSAVSGADTDASLYAMVPSTRPASSIISRHTVDSSSHNSSFAPSTHKSYASTKPTTLLSVDSGGGANRIAVVPGTGSHFFAGPSTGLSFSSAYPVSPSTPPTASPLSNYAPPFAPFASHHSPSSSSAQAHPHRLSSSSSTSSISLTPSTTAGLSTSLAPDSPSSAAHASSGLIGIPSHTRAHPRNNPHPAQPPPDNASVLTLASSSFAPSFIGSTGGESKTTAGREGAGRNSWTGGGLGGLRAWSTKQARSLGGGGGARSLAGVGGADGVADEDASVRALPGSRRNSEESLGGRSTWSAAIGAGRGGTSVRSRPLEDEASVAGVPGESTSRDRRTSMRTVETSAGAEASKEAKEGETEADGVKHIAEVSSREAAHSESTPPFTKGKGVDAAEHTGVEREVQLPPPVPQVSQVEPEDDEAGTPTEEKSRV